MSAQRTGTDRTVGAHVCRCCDLPLVQPEDAERVGRDWLVRLRYPSCGWRGEALLDQGQMERLDEELDDGFALLAAALARSCGPTCGSMSRASRRPWPQTRCSPRTFEVVGSVGGQARLHAAEEVGEGQRLREVLDGAEPERLGAVARLGAGGEDDDRHV